MAGVSPQAPERHREFREKYKLPFTLLSDVEKFVVKMYDLNGPLGLGVRRGTYLIDPGACDPKRGPRGFPHQPTRGFRQESHPIERQRATDRIEKPLLASNTPSAAGSHARMKEC